MKILRVADVPAGQLGGAALVLASTSRVLGQRGHQVEHLFSDDMPVPGPESLRRLLIPLALPFWVARRVRDDLDVVEVHEPLGAPYAALRALGLRRWLPPMVAFSHGLEERHWEAQKDRWRRLGTRGSLKSRLLVPLTLVAQARLALRLATRVIVLSTEDRDHLLHVRGLAPGRVHRVDNGADVQIAARGAVPEATTLLFLGSWIDRKGTPELARAFAGLAGPRPDVRLVVAGAGREPADVLADFAPAVRDRVQVSATVSRAEVAELLARADLFVLPSWFEGMPLSLLEALAAGVPAVVAGTCGMLDVIRPDSASQDGGSLVRPHDADHLLAVLEELVDDPEQRSRLADAARKRGSNFTWERSAEALEAVYHEAAGTARDARTGLL